MEGRSGPLAAGFRHRDRERSGTQWGMTSFPFTVCPIAPPFLDGLGKCTGQLCAVRGVQQQGCDGGLLRRTLILHYIRERSAKVARVALGLGCRHPRWYNPPVMLQRGLRRPRPRVTSASSPAAQQQPRQLEDEGGCGQDDVSAVLRRGDAPARCMLSQRTERSAFAAFGTGCSGPVVA